MAAARSNTVREGPVNLGLDVNDDNPQYGGSVFEFPLTVWREDSDESDTATLVVDTGHGPEQHARRGRRSTT